jgi:hypothetical protein
MSDINSKYYEKNMMKNNEVKSRSGSDLTVSQRAKINDTDLKNLEHLAAISQKLRSKQDDMNKQLLKYRGSMLDSSRRQYTNTIKECVEGLGLIKTLNASIKGNKGNNPIEKATNAILDSTNKTLGKVFTEFKIDNAMESIKNVIKEKFDHISMYKYFELAGYIHTIGQNTDDTIKIQQLNKLTEKIKANINNEQEKWKSFPERLAKVKCTWDHNFNAIMLENCKNINENKKWFREELVEYYNEKILSYDDGIRLAKKYDDQLNEFLNIISTDGRETSSVSLTQETSIVRYEPNVTFKEILEPQETLHHFPEQDITNTNLITEQDITNTNLITEQDIANTNLITNWFIGRDVLNIENELLSIENELLEKRNPEFQKEISKIEDDIKTKYDIFEKAFLEGENYILHYAKEKGIMDEEDLWMKSAEDCLEDALSKLSKEHRDELTQGLDVSGGDYSQQRQNTYLPLEVCMSNRLREVPDTKRDSISQIIKQHYNIVVDRNIEQEIRDARRSSEEGEAYNKLNDYYSSMSAFLRALHEMGMGKSLEG